MKTSFLLLVYGVFGFLINAQAAGPENWDMSASGRVTFFRGGKPAGGSCEALFEFESEPGKVFKKMILNATNCATKDRHYFALEFTVPDLDWVWKDGKPYFQGKVSGRITEKEILLYPWAFGFKLQVKKRNSQTVWVRWGFEHDNSLLMFEGNLKIKDKTAGVKP